MSDVDALASEVRNHTESPYTGEESQDKVIRDALENALARYDSQSELQERAEEKREELRADLGLSTGTPTDDGEEATEAEAEQARLREKITGDE